MLTMTTRDFSKLRSGPHRTIDNDAPDALRIEWAYAAFKLAGEAEQQSQGRDSQWRLYQLIHSALGRSGSVKPYGGYLKAASDVLTGADWPRFYDISIATWGLFYSNEDRLVYAEKTNELFAASGVVWDMVPETGQLERILPPTVQELARGAFEELSAPLFSAALELFAAAKTAFDARPRRTRDVGANAFDGLESAARIRMGKRYSTFGPALDAATHQNLVDRYIAEVLKKIEVVRHNQLGHGMTTQFSLRPDEVEFVYIACLMAARLFVRLQLVSQDTGASE